MCSLPLLSGWMAFSCVISKPTLRLLLRLHILLHPDPSQPPFLDESHANTFLLNAFLFPYLSDRVHVAGVSMLNIGPFACILPLQLAAGIATAGKVLSMARRPTVNIPFLR